MIRSLLDGRARVTLAAFTLAWLAALAFFWSWWLQTGHVVTVVGMAVNSAMLAFTLFMPSVFFIHLWRIAGADPRTPVPRLRAAIVVTKAPSEPWPVVRETLRAMLRQRYPHPYDVWLADEVPDPETLRWCEANGVRVSTRQHRAEYHRASWPRRTRCKEGNLAFFYDTWGYDAYDVVAQLDADHRPDRGYLAAMVRPFADPGVGYVAAPSICDANAASSWAARGRLHREATMHGPYQAGGHGDVPPLCIGSHYAVRTQALREAGGIGPELAEDFSTTLLLNAFGWTGVFALDAEAHGDGPETFADCMTQEFQWARSLNNVLLVYLGRYWHGLVPSAKAKLGFGLAWYPLFSVHLLIGTALPVVALLTRQPWVDVTIVAFLAHSLVVATVLVLMSFWLRGQGWLRPARAPILSWEGMLFSFARWPWVLFGILHSVAAALTRRTFGFKVTPKGSEEARPFPLRLVVPYVLIAGIAASVAILRGDPGQAAGYYWFCLLSAASYATVATAVVALHLFEFDAWDLRSAVRLAGAPLAATAVAWALVGWAVVLRGGVAVRALLPADVRDALLRAAHALPDDLATRHASGAPTWLVVVVGVGLLAAASQFAARASSLGRPAVGDAERVLLTVAGIASLVFVGLVALWSEGSGVSWSAFAGVLTVGALAATFASHRIRAALPAAARATTRAHAVDPLGPLGRVGLPQEPAPTLRPALSTPAALPPAPLPPVRWPETTGAAAVPADDAGWPAIEAEIAWWSHPGGSGFEIRRASHAPAGDVPARTPGTSRAHALLYDRLVLDGWRPAGRGDA